VSAEWGAKSPPPCGNSFIHFFQTTQAAGEVVGSDFDIQIVSCRPATATTMMINYAGMLRNLTFLDPAVADFG
jgi:hypothetical protein